MPTTTRPAYCRTSSRSSRLPPGRHLHDRPLDQHPDHNTTYKFVRAAPAARWPPTAPTSRLCHTTFVHWQDSTRGRRRPTPDATWSSLRRSPQTRSVEHRESLTVPAAMQYPDLAQTPSTSPCRPTTTPTHRGLLGRFIHRDEVFWIDRYRPCQPPPSADAGPDQDVIEQSTSPRRLRQLRPRRRPAHLRLDADRGPDRDAETRRREAQLHGSGGRGSASPSSWWSTTATRTAAPTA